MKLICRRSLPAAERNGVLHVRIQVPGTLRPGTLPGMQRQTERILAEILRT